MHRGYHITSEFGGGSVATSNYRYGYRLFESVFCFYNAQNADIVQVYGGWRYAIVIGSGGQQYGGKGSLECCGSRTGYRGGNQQCWV